MMSAPLICVPASGWAWEVERGSLVMSVAAGMTESWLVRAGRTSVVEMPAHCNSRCSAPTLFDFGQRLRRLPLSSRTDPMRHIISIVLQNEAGALSRVANLFSSRGYNIESLNVAPTDDETVSRLTLVTSG